MKNFLVRRRAHWMVMSLLVAVAGCGGDSPTGGGGGGIGGDYGGGNGGGEINPVATTSVTVGDNFFDPTDILVSAGVMVTWTWTSSVVHNVTFADNAIADSGDQGGGTYQTQMPTTAGEYAYQCTIHPSDMNGSVTVQ